MYCSTAQAVSKFKIFPADVAGELQVGLPSWPCNYLLSLKPGLPVFTEIYTDAKNQFSKALMDNCTTSIVPTTANVTVLKFSIS